MPLLSASTAAASAADDSDHEPFLLPITSSSSAATPASVIASSIITSSSSSSDGSSRRHRCVTTLRRLPRMLLRRVPLLCALCSVSSGVTWIVKGFFVCIGMMVMGGVSSFTLHQLMSPQIESLIRERAELRRDVTALQLQVDNITSIAESRLETIHVLEQALEKQAMQAAAAYAAAQYEQDVAGGGRAPGAGLTGGSFILPTIVYVGVLGCVILAVVLYRVYRIIQHEAHAHKSAMRHAQSQQRHDHESFEVPSSSVATRLSATASPTVSSSTSITIDASDNALDTDASESMQQQQQCYKRSQPPLPSPANRSLYV